MNEFDPDQPFADIEESNPEEEEELDRCRTDREELSNKETADCAGIELKEMYEQEETGGT